MRALLALVLVVPLAPIATAADPEWTPLFNGKDLTGWTPKIRTYECGENYGNTFRVEDGLLKVRYDKDKYPKFDTRYGHLFAAGTYSHYRIRVEYRFVGEQCPGGEGWALRNSGIMIHGQDPKTMDKDQNFPVSVEVQLLGGNGKDKRSTANMCSPGTNVVFEKKLYTTHCLNSKSKTFHGEEWVTVEVEVHGGGAVKHFVNGELAMEYEQPQYDPKDKDAKKLIKDEKNLILEGGTLSLQSESHPIDFRKVEMQVLKK